ncbi:MAG: hypothetical protein AcusKO_07230 [Acuticoccus sp.]
MSHLRHPASQPATAFIYNIEEDTWVDLNTPPTRFSVTAYGSGRTAAPESTPNTIARRLQRSRTASPEAVYLLD